MKKIFLAALLSILIGTQPSFAALKTSLSGVEKLFLEGRYDTVISEADTLITSGSPRKDELYYLKGLSQLKTNRFGPARTSFNYILSRYKWSKKCFDAYLGIGDSYLLGGDSAKALGIYSEMAVKFSSDKNIAIVYSRMALCYGKMGLRDKADRYTEMARRSAPMSFEAKIAPSAGQYARESAKINVLTESEARTPEPKTAQGSIVSIDGAGAYSVQVGSFRNKRNADKLARKLADSGYESYVAIPVISGDKFYRVKVGKFASKEEASKLAARMRSDGYNTKTCVDDICE